MAVKSNHSNDSTRLFVLLAFAGAITALYWAREILLPVALASVLSFVLSPLATHLEKNLRLGRVPSVVAVVLLVFALIGGVGWLATYQIAELGEKVPEYRDRIVERIRHIRNETGLRINDAKNAIEEIGHELTENRTPDDEARQANSTEASTTRAVPWPFLDDDLPKAIPNKEQAVAVRLSESPMTLVRNWLGPIVGPLSTTGMVIVLAVFIMLQRDDLRSRIIQLCGTANLYATTEAIDDAAGRLSRYVRMQLLVNTGYGAVVAGGLQMIGIPGALMWGVLAMLFRFLPYIGPWIGATLPIAMSLAVSDGWGLPLTTIGMFIAMELVVNNVIEPWLYGQSVGVSTVGVILAAIFWTWLWGPVGLVLAVPLTVCLVVVGMYVRQLRFLTVLLANGPSLAPHEQLYQRLLAGGDVAGEWIGEYLQDHDMMRLYDDIFIPTLRLAERDRHAGWLNEQQATNVLNLARELVDALGEEAADQREPGAEGDGRDNRPPCRVIAVPASDMADEVAAAMLQQVLALENFATEAFSRDLLANEVIDRVREHGCQAVVVVVLPPDGTPQARYLCKKLRLQFPDLRILVVLCHAVQITQIKQRLLANGADAVYTRLPAVVTALRPALEMPRLTAVPRESAPPAVIATT